jgi:NADH dehydrogenase (ubiquinone) Fe-S protein 5
VNGSEGVEGKKKCLFALEDYNECLHHSKEVRYLQTVEHSGHSTRAFPLPFFETLRLIWNQIVRAKRLQAAYRKAEATFPRENAPKAEDIRGLGLLGKESQSAKVLGLE